MENLHSTTQIPVPDNYAAALGKAVYVFAYYEWTIIYLIEHFDPGFLQKYSRPPLIEKNKIKPYSGGDIADLLDGLIKAKRNKKFYYLSDLSTCKDKFVDLVQRRNALIHAHPITFNDKQILGYQTTKTAKISAPDMIWELTDIESFIRDIDEAGVAAGTLLEKLKKIIQEKR